MDDGLIWPQVLIELRRKGYGLVAVARALNIPHSTVRGWQSLGSEPRYRTGLLLLRLHAHIVHGKPLQHRLHLTQKRHPEADTRGI